MRASKARSGRRAGQTCHRRWNAYGKHWPSHTRGGSRMRESRTYGSVRGACDETHVPTATDIDGSPGFTDRGWSGKYGPVPVLVLRTGRVRFSGPGNEAHPAAFFATAPTLGNETTLRLLARFFAIATAVVSLAARASAATASASSRLWKRFHVVDSILPRLSRMNARAH